MDIDNLTILLLGVLVILLLYSRYSRPSPLVHPLLLGKQADVSAVRKPGETGVYRSFATGQGTPLNVRPANTVKTVGDVVGSSGTEARCILDTTLTTESLAEITRLIPLGLQTIFPALTKATSESPRPILILLPPSPSCSLPLLLLQLSPLPHSPLIIVSHPSLLTSALTSSGHAKPAVVVVWKDLLEDVVEQVYEDEGESTGILIVGDGGREKREFVDDVKRKGMSVDWWEEVFEKGESGSEKGIDTAPEFADTHSYFYNLSSTGPNITKAHHLNITAGMAGVLSLFPADKRPNAALKDIVASSVRLDTPLGMTIALSSIWSGCGFKLIGNPEFTWEEFDDHEGQLLDLVGEGAQPPSILFINSKHHETLLQKLHSTLTSHPLFGLASRHKINGILDGHISRDSFIDRLILNPGRQNTLNGLTGDKLRAVIIVGDAPLEDNLGLSHLLLGIPHSRVHPSLLSSGPIFVSHFNDISIHKSLRDVFEGVLGDDGEKGERAHVGPPASNVEVILKGPRTELQGHEEGQESHLKGRIWARGPTLLERVDGGGEVVDGWVNLGEEAGVKTNGTFVITSSYLGGQ